MAQQITVTKISKKLRGHCDEQRRIVTFSILLRLGGYLSVVLYGKNDKVYKKKSFQVFVQFIHF